MFNNDGSNEIIRTLNKNRQRSENEIKEISSTLNKNDNKVVLVDLLIDKKILTPDDKFILQQKGLIEPPKSLERINREDVENQMNTDNRENGDNEIGD